MNDNEPRTKCAHDECLQNSMVKIKLHTGWANLCRKHYDFHFQLKADQANYDRNLNTVDEMRAWCKAKMGKQRAPGPWWKQEVLDKHARGEPVSIAALELASK